jgi:4-hydroxy-tetrahydrodipicolinate reductase
MKIALIGYGRMGKAVEEQALLRGHEIVFRSDKNWNIDSLKDAEVAIEFSLPSSAYNNIIKCIDSKTPVVSGTTGWTENLPKAIDYCLERNAAFLYASNFSTGVNLFFALNKILAKWMNAHPEYQVGVEEIHHVHKADKPSGTAISIAEGILQNYPSLEGWSLESDANSSLKINSLREGEVPGTHKVRYSSMTDDLNIEHVSHGREAFARGAVLAAEWISGKKGVFGMQDVLNLENLNK